MASIAAAVGDIRPDAGNGHRQGAVACRDAAGTAADQAGRVDSTVEPAAQEAGEVRPSSPAWSQLQGDRCTDAGRLGRRGARTLARLVVRQAGRQLEAAAAAPDDVVVTVAPLAVPGLALRRASECSAERSGRVRERVSLALAPQLEHEGLAAAVEPVLPMPQRQALGVLRRVLARVRALLQVLQRRAARVLRQRSQVRGFPQ
jgi:hypothetical protein